MSLIYMDSLSTYGSTDKASAVPFIGRSGWGSSGYVNHRTGGLFGQPFLATQGFYVGKTLINGYIGRTIPNSTKIGLSCKLALFFNGNLGGSNLVYPFAFWPTSGYGTHFGFKVSKTSGSGVITFK